jgi:hypothetical protein
LVVVIWGRKETFKEISLYELDKSGLLKNLLNHKMYLSDVVFDFLVDLIKDSSSYRVCMMKEGD